MLNKKSKITRTDEVVASDMDDEVVMMSVEQGKYFGLDPIAADIWKLLERTKTVGELIADLTQKYDVEETQCEKDVYEFLGQMEKNKLVFIN